MSNAFAIPYPRFRLPDPWRILRPLKMFDQGQFFPYQPIQFMDGLLNPVIGSGKSGVTSLSIFSNTNGSGGTIAWPASVVAGDIAILLDFAQNFSTPAPSVTTPAGFTAITTATAGTIRCSASYKLCVGGETGTITGMAGSSGTAGKQLIILRGNIVATAVSPSAWNSAATTGLQSIAAASGTAPLIVVALGISTSGAATFSTNTPTLTTQQFGTSTVGISGQLIYNSSPANHSVNVTAGTVNLLISGYVAVS